MRPPSGALAMRSTVPGWWSEPGLAEPLEGALRGVRDGAIEVEAVERGTRSRDVGAEGSRGADLGGERRAREVVRREGGEISRGLDPWQRVEERLAAVLPAAVAVARVEGGVDVRRRALHCVAWEEDNDPEVLRQVERRELAAVAGAELRAVREEERHVGTGARRERVQLAGQERFGERSVREAECRRGVGAAAAEPGRERDALLDLHPPARLDSGRRRKALEGRPNNGVALEAVDAKRGRFLDLDPVDKVDALEDGEQLVLAVLARRPDDEGEVELRGCRRPHHPSASVSATNSGGESDSARAFSGRPSISSAAAARSREARPASASEFGSVFRRCANAAATTCLSRAKSAGITVRRNATSAESTLGGGRKTVLETGWKPVRSAASWTSTDTAP